MITASFRNFLINICDKYAFDVHIDHCNNYALNIDILKRKEQLEFLSFSMNEDLVDVCTKSVYADFYNQLKVVLKTDEQFDKDVLSDAVIYAVFDQYKPEMQDLLNSFLQEHKELKKGV